MFAFDRLKSAGRLVALSTIALLGACGSSTSPLAPFSPQINNIPDNFHLQASNVTNVTSTITYTWANSGTAASAGQSTTIAAGTAMLTVLDANGAQVYSQSLSANGTFPTTTGMTGNWTITLTLTNYSGTLNFQVQKA
jgi:hypothetical protein